MRTIARSVVFAALALSAQSPAFAAGTMVTQDVTIATGGLVLPGTGGDVTVYSNISYATGALGSARNSNAGDKEIGCKIVPTLQGPQATCLARIPVSAGAVSQLSCVTKDPQLVSIVASLHGDSVVTFYTFLLSEPSADYDPGECVTITLENSSKYEPKK